MKKIKKKMNKFKKISLKKTLYVKKKNKFNI